jgi:hypothetical protein
MVGKVFHREWPTLYPTYALNVVVRLFPISLFYSLMPIKYTVFVVVSVRDIDVEETKSSKSLNLWIFFVTFVSFVPYK